MGKNLVAVSVLLLLGLVGYLLTGSPEVGEQEDTFTPPSPLSFDCMDKIGIRKNVGPGRKGVAIVLEKQDAKWKMTSPIDCSVDMRAVGRMIHSLGSFKVTAQVSEKKNQLTKFGLHGGSGIHVRAFCGESELAHLIIGLANGDITYIKNNKSDAVYQTVGSLRSTFNKTAKNLRDKRILDIDKKKIDRIKYTNAGGELTLEKQTLIIVSATRVNRVNRNYIFVPDMSRPNWTSWPKR